MKKLLVCLLCVGLLFGCSTKKDSPTKAVETYLKDVKGSIETSSNEAINKLWSGESFTIPADLLKKLGDFSYKIENEKIDGTNATVDIKFTTYNFGEAFTVEFPTIFAHILQGSFSGADSTTLQREAEQMLIDAFNKAEKDFTATMSVSLHQDSNKAWVIDDTSELENVFTGNLGKAIEDLSSSFNMPE